MFVCMSFSVCVFAVQISMRGSHDYISASEWPLMVVRTLYFYIFSLAHSVGLNVI